MIITQYGFTGIRLLNQYDEIMPLPPITPQNEGIVSQIEGLVDKILQANASTGSASNPQADTSEWEREIDELVYRLYNLTDDEIAVMEASLNR